MDKRMAELVKFSQSFKVCNHLILNLHPCTDSNPRCQLNKPIPDDLVPILAKDEEKQKAIRDKASKDAASSQARTIGAATAANASRGTQVPPSKMNADLSRRPLAPTKTATTNLAASVTTQKVAAASKPTNSSDPAVKTVPLKPNPSMFIQAIPPFKGKSRSPAGTTPAVPATGTIPANPATPGSGSGSGSNPPATAAASSTAATAAGNNRLNVNASSFRPNPKANAFTPVTSLFFHAD